MKKIFNNEENVDKKRSTFRYVLIIYAVFMLIIFSILLVSLFDVNYGISLKKDNVEQGENVTLVFHITNYLFFVDINHISYDYWVEQNNSIVLNETKINISSINSFSSYEGNITIPTYKLEKGTYTVWTQLTYSMGKGRKGIGNREAILLSWDFLIE